MFKQDFTCPALLKDQIETLPIQGYHLLWLTFPDHSGCFQNGHWPGPRSLVTTNGVSVDVLSSGYLDISVPRVRSLAGDLTVGFPHSEISGSKLVCQLTEAYRRLLRPSSPYAAKASTTCAYSLDLIT